MKDQSWPLSKENAIKQKYKSAWCSSFSLPNPCSYLDKFWYVYVFGIKISKKPPPIYFKSRLLYFTEFSNPLLIKNSPVYLGPESIDWRTSVSKHFLKIISNGLQMVLPKIFHIRILNLLWPWALLEFAYQGRSQNLKEVPQNFMKVFKLMTLHLMTSYRKTKSWNKKNLRIPIVIATVKLASLAKRKSVVVLHLVGFKKFYTLFECFYSRFSKSK